MSRLRYKLCKMWKCRVDDPIFEDINGPQWCWYAQMIAADEVEEFNAQLQLSEYLASFWNSDGVKKVREMRERKENPNIDEEFNKVVSSGDYKTNPLIQALQKIRENANLMNKDIDELKTPNARRVKAPINLEQLSKTTKI